MQRGLIQEQLGQLSKTLRSSAIEPAREWFGKRSEREQWLVIGGTIAVIVTTIGFIGLGIRERIDEQTARYEAALASISEAREHLKSHKALIASRREVENFFRRVDDHQNPLSLLENLFKENLGDEARPRITETGSKNFGQQFRQTTFRVSDIRISSLEKLLTIVNSLTTGKAPFLITNLIIDKNGGSGRLDVRLDVSTVSKGQVAQERD
jgi:predicted hotdog family 3-hydroxylacyl-ACP dehydratase